MGTGLTTPAPAGVPIVYAQGVAVAGYGGFWIRLVAFIVDGIIVRVITFPFAAILTAAGLLHRGARFGRIEGPEDVIPIVTAVLRSLTVFWVVNWLYEALLTSSEWQATLGKKMLNLRVTDEAGNRISFARASGRHFAKYLSYFLLIGFIMAAFTDRKRALHDIIAGTVVRQG
ncbi:MAG TPA: RDD family protein [Candidatus Angelobacter sp.]|nr:RDD family protein [Candidatus Angelobacter sp.]